MKMNFRPFLEIEVVEAMGATIGILYFSVTLVAASAFGRLSPVE